MSDKIQVNLSSTALGQSGCILRFHRTVIDGYKEIPSAKIVYGVAVHKFIDTMYKTGGDMGAGFNAMKKAFALQKEPETKSAHIMEERHVMNTCQSLWFGFCADDSTFEIIQMDGKSLTEQTFSIPYYEDDYIQVNLCGTIDKIGQFKGGCFAIGDWKTTSYSYKPEGYFRRYELSRQTRFYTLACKLMAQREPDSTLGRIGATHMGAFIDGIFLKPNANDNVVQRSEVFQYRESELNEFQQTVDDFIRKLSNHVRTGYLPKEGIVNGSCEGKYECQYWNVCKNREPISTMILNKEFKRVPFNPLDYNELE